MQHHLLTRVFTLALFVSLMVLFLLFRTGYWDTSVEEASMPDETELAEPIAASLNMPAVKDTVPPPRQYARPSKTRLSSSKSLVMTDDIEREYLQQTVLLEDSLRKKFSSLQRMVDSMQKAEKKFDINSNDSGRLFPQPVVDSPKLSSILSSSKYAVVIDSWELKKLRINYPRLVLPKNKKKPSQKK